MSGPPRFTRGRNPDWDFDMPIGEEAERQVAREMGWILERDDRVTVETKCKSYIDDKFYVEAFQSSRDRNVGVWAPSGINRSRADLWVFTVADTGVSVTIPRLLLVRAINLGAGTPKEETDGSNPTKGQLFSLRQVLAVEDQRRKRVEERKSRRLPGADE